MLVPRHSALVRLTHWVNVLCFLLLLSGLQIFNAHPELYWGKYGADNDHSFIAIGAVEDGDSIAGRHPYRQPVHPDHGSAGRLGRSMAN